MTIVTLLAILLVPVLAAAQPAATIPTVGVLEPGPPPAVRPQSCSELFKHGLGQLGYQEGHTIRLEARYADFQYDRLPTLAAELVTRKPDVLWTHSGRAGQALKHATATIPIVVGITRDFVELGLGESLARPGGNLTGLEMRRDEFEGKHLELLKAAVPPITRVAVLVDPRALRFGRPPPRLEKEAQGLGLHLLPVEAGEPEVLAEVFAAMAEHRAEALMIVDSQRLSMYAPQIVELAVAHRLPTISFQRSWAEAGSLLSYGVNLDEMCRHSATYVDRILKGAKPADLPVEGPTKFELIINLKTAEALGLTIPPTLLFQADEVLR
jgi:putative tryptophan/tyrosine transport system substrate-binding protein